MGCDAHLPPVIDGEQLETLGERGDAHENTRAVHVQSSRQMKRAWSLSPPPQEYCQEVFRSPSAVWRRVHESDSATGRQTRPRTHVPRQRQLNLIMHGRESERLLRNGSTSVGQCEWNMDEDREEASHQMLALICATSLP